MSIFIAIILMSWAAGITAFAGGLLATFEGSAESQTKDELIHAVVAFGGGALLAAVAFALAPHGMEVLSPGVLALAFCAGGLVFCGLDIWLAKRGGSFAQFLAMLMDFLPEALSLGAVFSENKRMGIVLATFIGLQNLPEGFNAFREMKQAGAKTKTILWVLFAISFIGPLAALTGHFFLQNKEELTAIIMTFAAGGIVYLIFQDIAPQAVMQRHWLPPLGAVLGFLLGMLGSVVL